MLGSKQIRYGFIQTDCFTEKGEGRRATHTKLLKTQRALMAKHTESGVFFRTNPEGGSHLYLSLTAKMRSFACTSDLCSTVLDWGHILVYEYGSFGSSHLEISCCYSQCGPVFASDFLSRNTCTHMSQCRLRKPGAVGSLISHIEKTKFTNGTSIASGRRGTAGWCVLQ